jgi:peptidoglycan/LPS O-acetylase OafA/YrhL
MTLLAVNQGFSTGVRVIDFGLPMVLVMSGVLGLEPFVQRRPIRLMKDLGDTSYAMYLIHPFVLAGGAMVLGKLGLSNILGGYFFVTVLLLGSLITGYLVFHMVEKPLTKIFCRRTPRPIPSVLTKNA